MSDETPHEPTPTPKVPNEQAQGHGHGMSGNRTPKSDTGLPHDDKRDDKQPYSREVEEYSDAASRSPRGAPENADKPSSKDR